MNDQPIRVGESEETGRRWDTAMIIKGKFMNGKQVVRFNVKLLPQHSHEDEEKSNRRYIYVGIFHVCIMGFHDWINRSG
jgi:hypothetical protein